MGMGITFLGSSPHLEDDWLDVCTRWEVGCLELHQSVRMMVKSHCTSLMITMRMMVKSHCTSLMITMVKSHCISLMITMRMMVKRVVDQYFE